MALIEIKNLSFKYNGSTEKALNNVSITVNEGDFVLLCGESGCGKTTLMRMLKPALTPAGEMQGEIFFRDCELEKLSPRDLACDIGYVMQNPETQTITDTVIGELSFGLQSMGMSQNEIEAKIAEVCGFFGIGDWYCKKTAELSGGQKQLVALASVMAMKPSLLLLDEPTAQLDPVSAREFLNCLIKLNGELGITVIVSEHRLEEVFAAADKVVMLENGGVLLCESPREVGKKLWAMKDGDLKGRGLPTPTRIYRALGGGCDCPITVREGKSYISSGLIGKKIAGDELAYIDKEYETAVALKNIRFGYGKSSPMVLDGLELEVHKGEFMCLLGGNGCGKTTLLKLIGGLIKPIFGEYRLFGSKTDGKKPRSVCYLPQNPMYVFSGDTLEGCFMKLACALEFDREIAYVRMKELLDELRLTKFANRHPYDLSGGEAQRAAIALALFTEPQLLLLDEPTKGQDAGAKLVLAEIIAALLQSGKTVITATHDLDFAAENADRCAMLFGGRITSLCESVKFFAQNDYYTTAAARMTRPCLKSAVTVERAIGLCRSNGFAHE